MSFKCGFFNAINGDRKYNAEDMTNPYKRIISNGVFGKPNGELSDDFQVLINGAFGVTVQKGQGLFFNKWAELDEPMDLTIPTPDIVNTRIDSVVVRIDTSSAVRAGSVVYRVGTAASTPTAPTLENSKYVKEYRLCNIAVAPNTTAVTQSNITDTRPSSECGIIHNLLWDSDVTAFYEQWHAQFSEWFNNIKSTLATATIISSLTSRYTADTATDTIPINISRFNSELDILQVYINGLLESDFTVSADRQSVTLKHTIKAGSVVDFICYKSMDGSEAESVVRLVDNLVKRVEKIEKQNTVLWSGNKTTTIKPSKKLSECLTGYVLVWVKNDGTGYATSFIPRVLPNGNVWAGQGFYSQFEKVVVRDDSLTFQNATDFYVTAIFEH